MKLTILQENLSEGLVTASKTTSSKGQLPILANILFEANKEGLKITSTNLETSINIFLPAKVEKQGSITIPARIITEFTTSLPTDKVLLDLEKEKLRISCLSYKAVINGISASEFPHVPSLKKISKDQKKIKLEQGKFSQAINQVAFAAATDATRPVLNGVRISSKKGKIQMVATDGYRLSLSEFKTVGKTEIPTLIVPARTLIELARIIEAEGEKEEQVELAVTKETNQVIFSIGKTEVISRLIEGEFPEFGKIIPEKGEIEAVVDKEEFTRSVRSASIFARDSANIVRLKIKDQRLKISANTPEVGENEIELGIKSKGGETKIAFNCRFLQDFLSVFSKENFVFETSGSLKPGLFRAPQDSSFLHIIMPVRVQD